ncbi:MAG: NAD(P)H-dependent oxidoreductase subunit E [Candidatus Moranbacteria bacterium]|nr:NAD(P)H-dependent oxidoreductase subunit E [Candidatus Moranbacteria bacterium]
MNIQKILLRFGPKAENLLAALREIQKENGYIGEKESKQVAEYFGISEAQAYSAASFYDLLETGKPVKKIIRVCSGGVCVSERSLEIIRQVERMLHIELDNDAHPKYKLETMSCVGRCDRGPVMEIDGKIFEGVRVEMVGEILKDYI